MMASEIAWVTMQAYSGEPSVDLYQVAQLVMSSAKTSEIWRVKSETCSEDLLAEPGMGSEEPSVRRSLTLALALASAEH